MLQTTNGLLRQKFFTQSRRLICSSRRLFQSLEPTRANSLIENHEDSLAKTEVLNKQYSTGNQLLKVAISRAAVKQLNKITSADENQNLGLRILVESGGCHGFQYHVNLIDLFKDKLIGKDLNDTTVAGLSDEDVRNKQDSVFIRGQAKVVLDNPSLQILRESKIDYVKELIGSSFKVIDSPFTKTACGCGSSFDVDFSKLEA